MKFIRENPTLVFGLGLPLLLVALFLIAAELPQMGATPPQQSLVFASDYYNGDQGVRISVENNKIHITYNCPCGQNYYGTTPHIYLFDFARNSAREINFTLPNEAKKDAKNSSKVITVHVPELDALTLDDSSISPDGFEFMNYDSYHRDPFGGLFFSGGSYRDGVILKKGSYKYHIPMPEKYYGSSLRLIGWVIQK